MHLPLCSFLFRVPLCSFLFRVPLCSFLFRVPLCSFPIPCPPSCRTLLFWSASHAASSWAFCEAHLPPGCALVVVRGSRKLREYLPHPTALAAAKARAPPHSQTHSQPQPQPQSQPQPQVQFQEAAAAALEPRDASQSHREASSGHKAARGPAPTAASKFLRAFSGSWRFESLDASRLLPQGPGLSARAGGPRRRGPGLARAAIPEEGEGVPMPSERPAPPPAVTPWRSGSLGTPGEGQAGTGPSPTTLHSIGMGSGSTGAFGAGAGAAVGICACGPPLATASERFSHSARGLPRRRPWGPWGPPCGTRTAGTWGRSPSRSGMEEEEEEEEEEGTSVGSDGTQSMHGGGLGLGLPHHPPPHRSALQATLPCFASSIAGSGQGRGSRGSQGVQGVAPGVPSAGGFRIRASLRGDGRRRAGGEWPPLSQSQSQPGQPGA